MEVASLSFLALLAAAVIVLRLTGPAGQVPVLLAAGAVFYLSGGTAEVFWSAGVLCLSGAVTLWAARRMAAPGKGAGRVYAAAAAWHILVLGAFKYTAFFSGGALRPPFVPLGLSFFTFQQLWFLHEAYTGRFCASAPPADYLAYCFFFPTVTSGPILRPQNFFPQLRRGRPTPSDTAAGLYALGLGLAKKVLLANNLGVLADNGWARCRDLTALSAWCVIFGYTLQLYFDFSGYCDIAAGSARLLGLRLPMNFDAPYRSLSVTAFWKRWHMTLTDFLRENVYFPLGGSRRGRGRTDVNIVLVFLISGIWHGAGWTFLLWGGAHGLALAAERHLGRRLEALPKALRWGGTFLFVSLAWVLFRAPSLSDAGAMLCAAVRGGGGGLSPWLTEGLLDQEFSALAVLVPGLRPYETPLLAAGVLGAGLLAALWPRSVARQMDTFRPCWQTCLWVLLLAAWAILSFTAASRFIYADF